MPGTGGLCANCIPLFLCVADLQQAFSLQSDTWPSLVVLVLLVKSTALLYLYRRKRRSNRQLRHALQLLRATTHQLSEETQAVSQLNAQLQAAHQTREQLTLMLVHDLKSPVHSILVSGHIAEPSLRQQLIEGSALQLHHLIHNILDVHKHEGGSLPTDVQPVRLVDTLHMALVQVKLLLDLKNQTLHMRIEPQSLSLMADPDLLLRMLVNLLSNANKYGQAGQPIECVASCTEGGWVRVEVCNQGPPIPADYRPNLFELYRIPAQLRQGHFTYSTGLGLAFCRMAIEAQGGRIGFHSPDAGPVTFWFELPAVLST
jgi:signal transduction histidine kinase